MIINHSKIVSHEGIPYPVTLIVDFKLFDSLFLVHCLSTQIKANSVHQHYTYM